ncbi:MULTISPECIES: hypothetical protein [unclassified Mesorhizobium]|uniref:hypothetical protein n=1 Tax=unclassified Mesorhizobium TaxID=325217 RepID=UPI002414F3E8|nr:MULTISPECIES: hypothetical protein [unclassified Mesorhizobium]MDG4904768.1 hypothetical protein [Mesorhizobium sp. WSM4962]MDG4906292.1 hypothetical protein [Mesorhizobium sp. WSM4898]MDG4920279.1 hypothetical protein [Mesorhizobium sp. WSM4989]
MQPRGGNLKSPLLALIVRDGLFCGTKPIKSRCGPLGTFPMAETGQELSDRAQAHKQLIVQFLTRETGITEAQARDLVDMIGNAPASLLREARLLKKL